MRKLTITDITTVLKKHKLTTSEYTIEQICVDLNGCITKLSKDSEEKRKESLKRNRFFKEIDKARYMEVVNHDRGLHGYRPISLKDID